LLRTKYDWSDALWAEAEGLLWDGISVDEGRAMCAFVDGSPPSSTDFGAVRRGMGVFRIYPTTVFLGAYDLMLHRRELGRELDQLLES
jgi:hypothetical protein